MTESESKDGEDRLLEDRILDWVYQVSRGDTQRPVGLQSVWRAVGLFLIAVTGGLAVLIPWLYFGFFGNWDLYLWEKRGKTWW